MKSQTVIDNSKILLKKVDFGIGTTFQISSKMKAE